MFLIHIFPMTSIRESPEMSSETAEFIMQLHFSSISAPVWHFIHNSGECLKRKPKPIVIK